MADPDAVVAVAAPVCKGVQPPRFQQADKLFLLPDRSQLSLLIIDQG